MILPTLLLFLSYCSVPYNKLNKEIREKYDIVPYFLPDHYLHVQHLKRPYKRYIATFGKGGSLHEYGEFLDPRTAALVSLYALNMNKNIQEVYEDLGLH